MPGVDVVRDVYQRWARSYDLEQWLPERVLLAGLRRRLISKARGAVLEVGIGTGANLPYYGKDCQIVGVDLSRSMLERAAARAQRLGVRLSIDTTDAEALPYKERTFDSVISTFTLCTTPDPIRLLREMARVCQPDGRVLLLEHGLGSAATVNWLLHRLARRHLARYACHLTRSVDALPEQAGLRVFNQERHLWGILTLTEASG